MRTEKFEIRLHELLFSDEGKSLVLDATLTVGNHSLRWSNPPIVPIRLARFLLDTLDSYSWDKPYNEHDLSTDGKPLTVNWKSTGEIGAIYCLLQTESGLHPPVPVWPGHIPEALSMLQRKILTHCCLHFSQPVTAFWAKSLGMNSDEHAKFKTGERVRTVIGENVNTERTGWVWSSWNHHERNCTVYQLLIDNSVYRKWYFEDDLQQC
ncbi:hypothetical protein Enr10x_07890 [Gimesia panareensis]|uniref:Uncharacterized protein n=2 Tax=Gimesia panareensis TaxID=2527978 RepID=A0A517Q1H9_9PLAN|nr:hypothetical protein Enr10x_07890 [Gimesia panareensis]